MGTLDEYRLYNHFDTLTFNDYYNVFMYNSYIIVLYNTSILRRVIYTVILSYSHNITITDRETDRDINTDKQSY